MNAQFFDKAFLAKIDNIAWYDKIYSVNTHHRIWLTLFQQPQKHMQEENQYGR